MVKYGVPNETTTIRFYLKSEGTPIKYQNFDVKLTAYGRDERSLAHVSVNSFEVKQGNASDIHSFDVTYDCPSLMRQVSPKRYFDTVVLHLSDDTSSIDFEYIIVCDPPQLKNFDLNFVLLFLIAIAVVVVAIKTP